MKKMLLMTVLALAVSGTVTAQEIPRFELGVILGEPTGLSGKLWTGERGAFDAAAAWSFTEGGMIDVYLDYLFHYASIDIDPGALPLNFGIGGTARIGTTESTEDDEVRLGVRVPFGAQYLFENAPITAFAEIAPVMELIPATDFGLNGGIGIRFVW